MLVQKMMQTEAVYTMFCSSCTLLCLLFWARVSRVTSGKYCNTAMCSVHHGRLWHRHRLWHVIISTYKVKKTTLKQNRIWKKLLSPSINGTITTQRSSYCHIFSFDITWNGYILNHGYQMKDNSMKMKRYTATFWTFLWVHNFLLVQSVYTISTLPSKKLHESYNWHILSNPLYNNFHSKYYIVATIKQVIL